jgi:hypothetical protein
MMMLHVKGNRTGFMFLFLLFLAIFRNGNFFDKFCKILEVLLVDSTITSGSSLTCSFEQSCVGWRNGLPILALYINHKIFNKKKFEMKEK